MADDKGGKGKGEGDKPKITRKRKGDWWVCREATTAEGKPALEMLEKCDDQKAARSWIVGNADGESIYRVVVLRPERLKMTKVEKVTLKSVVD